jgi:predicted PurR-regulated permease PerM
MNQQIRLAAPTIKGVIRLVAILAGCALALYLVWRVRDVVRLVAIALFFALTLNPVVDAIQARLKVHRAATILAVYLALAGAVVVAGVAVVPSMAGEVKQLSRNAPGYTHDLRQNSTFRKYDDRYHISAKLERDARQLPQHLQQATGSLQQVTVQAFGVAGQLATVLTLAFLLMLHGREYVGMALKLTGPREARYRALVVQINRAVAQYMLGNVAISVLCTVATWIVLTILGVPYALALAIVVGFFDLLPLVGATIGAVIVAIATLGVDFPTATIVWIVFTILYQRFENDLIQPLVYGKTLQINPIVTIVSVLVGASLLGILGALLAIPVAAAVQILLRDWWNSRTGAPTDDAPAPGVSQPYAAGPRSSGTPAEANLAS